MASYLAPYLEKFLAEYFSNFNSENLTIGYTGSATLSDLNLRSDVLDQFNLPFRVIGGKVGTLYISLGGLFGVAKLLTSTPFIEVTLSDVYLLAVPPTALAYDKEREEKKILDRKRKDLNAVQEKKKAAAADVGKPKEEESGEPGFVGQLIVGLINNIKVTIENIHIRFEDNQLNPTTPFSMGVVLKSLTAETVDQEWNPCPIEKTAKTFWKLADLQGFGAYWNSHEKDIISTGKDTSDESLTEIVAAMKEILENDTGRLNYILGPLDTKVKAMVTMKPEKLDEPFSLPKADVTIEMPKLGIGLSNNQFRDATGLAGSLKIMSAAMPYRKYRPHGIPYKGHAKEWWKFASDCLLVDVRRRHQNWSWERMKAHRTLCRKYKEVYTKVVIDDAPTDEDKAEAVDLEDQLDNFNVSIIRNPIDLAALRKAKLIAEKTKSLWYGTATLTKEELDEILSGKLPEDEVSNIYALIDYEPPKGDEEPVAKPPIDWAAITAAFNLPLIQVQASNVLDVVEAKSEKVLNFEIRDIAAGFSQYPEKEGMKAELKIDDIGITGLETEGVAPPVMLRAVKSAGETKFLTICFEKNPFDSPAAIKLKFNSEQLEFVYHGKTVQKLLECFTPAVKVEASKPKSKLSVLEKPAAQNVKAFLSKNEEMDIDISFSAPFIVIPENGELTEGASALIIDLGNLSLRSIERTKALPNSTDLNTLLEEVGNGKVGDVLLGYAFNQYHLQLTDFHFMMAMPGENKSCSPTPGAEPPATFLNTGKFLVKLYQSILPEDQRLPKINVDADIPLLSVEITDNRLIKLACVALTFPIPAKPASTSVVSLPENPEANLASELEYVQHSATETVKAEVKKKLAEEAGNADETKGGDIDPEKSPQATNLAAILSIKEFKIRLLKEKSAKGKVELQPLLDFRSLDFNAAVKARTYGTAITASIGGISAAYLEPGMGDPLNPTYLLKTPINQDGEWDPLIVVHVFMVSPDWPQGSVGVVKKRIEVQMTTLDITLHQECMGTVHEVVGRLTDAMAQAKPPPPPEPEIEEIIVIETGNDEAEIVTIKVAKPYDGHPDDTLLYANISLASISLVFMCKAKSIMKLEVEEILVDFEDRPLQSVALVNLSSISIDNLDTPTNYPSIMVGVNNSEKLIVVQATTYKGTDRGDTEPDLDVQVTIGSHRITILGAFLGNLVAFGNHFQAAKKLVAKASADAAKKAAAAVKEAYRTNASKMSLDFKLNAPEFVLPKNSTSREALSVNLGFIKIHNNFTAVPSDHLATNAVVDNLVLGLKGLKISRVFLNPNDQGVQAETPILPPVTIDLNVHRNLSSSWYNKLPGIKAAANLEPFVAEFSGDDLSLLGCALLGIVYEVQAASPADSDADSSADVTTTAPKAALEPPPDAPKEEKEPDKLSYIASADIKISRVGVTVYTKTPSLEDQQGLVERDQALTLAETFIENTSLDADIWSNSNMNVAFFVQNMVLKDSRKNSGTTEVTDFLQRRRAAGTENTDKLIDVKFDAKTGEDGRKSFNVNASTASLQLVLNLTFVKTLSEVAKNILDELPKPVPRAPTPRSDDDDEDDDDEDDDDDDDDEDTGKAIVITGATPDTGERILDISEKPEAPLPLVNANVKFQELVIVVLQDASSSDTNAIMLSVMGNFDMKSEADGSHGGGELVLKCNTTKYGKDGQSGPMADILSPAKLSVTVDLTQNEGTSVGIKLSDMAIRLSAGTILLLSKIGASVSKSLSAISVKTTDVIDHTGTWKAKKNGASDYWFLDSARLQENADDHRQALKPTNKMKKFTLPGLKPQIKEKLTLSTECIVFSLETGAGLATTPVISVDARLSTKVTNWSSNLSAEGSLKLSAAYNNAYYGKWEYIIEPVEEAKVTGFTSRPWELAFNASRPHKEDAISVEIKSKDILELSAGKTTFGVLTDLSDSFKAAAGDAVSEGNVKSAPYVIKNLIGSEVIINIDNTPFLCTQNGEFVSGDIKIANRDDLELSLKSNIGSSSEVQAERELKVSIPDRKFNATISVSQGMSRYFPLPAKPGQTGSVNILFDIAITNGSSTLVTIRSIVQITNEIAYPVDIYKSAGAKDTMLGTVQPNESWSLLTDDVYEKDAELKFKVQGYELSTASFAWNKLMNKNESIEAKPEGGSGDNANVKLIGVSGIAVRENTGKKALLGTTIHLQGHFLLNNLLPIPLIFESDGKTVLQIEAGRSKNIFCVTPKSENEYEFNLKMPSFRGTSWSTRIHISDSEPVLTPAIFTSEDGKDSVCLGYQKIIEGESMTVNVYCPYWMVNYTGLTLSYKGSKGSHITTQAPEDEGPILFAYEKNLGGEKALIKCEESEWSTPMSMDAAGLPGGIICESTDRKYELTVSLELSECGLAKFVTFTARHKLVNACPYPLIVQETDQPDDLVKVPALSSIPFYPRGSEKKLKVKADDPGADEETPPIFFDRVSDNFLRLDNKYAGLRALVQVSETSIVIGLSEFLKGEVPIIIVNDTADIKLRLVQKDASGAEERLVPSGENFLYAWDDVIVDNKSLEWGAFGYKETFKALLNLNKDEAGEFNGSDKKKYKWVSISNGLQRIVFVTENDQTYANLKELLVSSSSEQTSATLEGSDLKDQESNEKASLKLSLELAGIGFSLVNNVAGKDIIYLRLNSTEPVWEASGMGEEHFRLVDHHQNIVLEHGYENFKNGVLTDVPAQLEGGIEIDFTSYKMTKPSVQQLRRHPYRGGLVLKFTQHANSLEVDLRISELQIDNQTEAPTYPRVFVAAPIPVSVTTTTEVGPPMVLLKVKKSSPPESSVQLISATVILQEFNVGVDMGLIDAIVETVSNDSAGKKAQRMLGSYQNDYEKAILSSEDYFAGQVADSKAHKTIMIFDDVQLYKLKFNLSFSMAGGTSTYNPVKVLVASLGSTLVSITEKPFDINGLHIQHLRATPAQLTDQIVSHYKYGVIKNMFNVVLQLDVLGNPYKLLTGLGTGVSALLTEPFQGALQGHLIEGISSGVGTVLDSTVGNLLGSVSLLTGSLAKGTEALGLGFLPLGYLSSGISGLRNIAKKKEKGTNAIRLPRPMKAKSYLEPYSAHKAQGISIFNSVQGGKVDYVSHTFTDGPHLILLTEQKVYSVTMDEELKTVSATGWGHKWDEFADITGGKTWIDFNQKDAGSSWGFSKRDTHLKVNFANPEVCAETLKAAKEVFARATAAKK